MWRMCPAIRMAIKTKSAQTLLCMRRGKMESWRDRGMEGCRDGGMEGWRGFQDGDDDHSVRLFRHRTSLVLISHDCILNRFAYGHRYSLKFIK